MSPNQVIPPAARPLTPVAIALVVMLCVSWGFNQIAVKLALPDIPPLTQGAAMLERFRGVNIGLGGAIPVLEAAGCHLVPAIWAGASPSAHVTGAFLPKSPSSMPMNMS